MLALYAETVVSAVRVRRRGRAWRVEAPNAPALADLVISAIGASPITEVRVRVATWRAPAGWQGDPGIGGITASSLRARGTGCELTLTVADPIDPGTLLAAALRMLRPVASGITPLITVTPGLPATARPLATSVRDVLVHAPEPDPHLRRCDTLIVPNADTFADVPRSRTVVISPNGWEVDGRPHEVWVDPLIHRPVGRRSGIDPLVGRGTVVDGSLRLDAPGVRLTVDGDLSSADVYRLRPVTGIEAVDLPPRWRAQLAACGVIVGEQPAGPLDRDAASVRARRHALRASTPAAALDAWPTVSVLLVTHRTGHLEHALGQLARIRYPRLQVVIGLHGVEVPDEHVDALRSHHEVHTVAIDGQLSLGEALQVATAHADGELVTKVDDDDYYGSEHVWDLVLARMYSGAELVGKALDWIYVEAEDVTAFRPVYPAESYSTFVAGGTLLISRADLADAGGWRPVPKSVDRALIDAVKRDGGLVYRTHGLGYVYVRHGGSHTALVDDAHFLTKTAERVDGLVAHEAFGTS